jgi:hypothetical protein
MSYSPSPWFTHERPVEGATVNVKPKTARNNWFVVERPTDTGGGTVFVKPAVAEPAPVDPADEPDQA